MSNIGPVDRAVLNLRLQLQRLARERARETGVAPAEPRPLTRLRETGGPPAAGDPEFRRKFVRALLFEELGDELANHPEFERISNEVWALLDEDPETRAMMGEAIDRLAL